MTRCLALMTAFASLAFAQTDRIHLQLNTDEAEAVLTILAKSTPTNADWQRLFTSEPYVRLQKREAQFHNNFTDDDFKQSVLSPDMQKQATELRRTLGPGKKPI